MSYAPSRPFEFEPLAMNKIGFTLNESMKPRRVTIHDRAADGKITALQDCASYPGFVDFETAVNHHLQR
jgi:hypothetical protein